MRLPGLDRASIPREKLVDYLLSTTHPEGRHKAAFFLDHGFSAGAPTVLTEALRGLAMRHEVAGETSNDFGMKYVIDGNLPTPDGRSPRVRTVWIIERGESFPRFITAYPIPR